MFIAMNRFKVIKEERRAFEDLWVKRQSYLSEVKGFQAFHLLRGPEREDHVLYSSHSIWASQENFTEWTKSEQFRAAHQHAGEHKPLTLGHPEFEGFEVVQTIETMHPPSRSAGTGAEATASGGTKTSASGRTEAAGRNPGAAQGADRHGGNT
jgi:heme-degrading monooxygenase HmoA